jgi:uncharacterized repeat protein (TIGR01451 family)
MKLNLHTIKRLVSSIPKRLSITVLLLMLTTVISANVLASGPDRPTYTVAQPSDHITFNSITDNPDQGDERNFVQVKDASNTNAGGWKDSLNVEDGKEYLVRIFYHNNAASNLNLVATNTRVTANVPATTGKSVQIDGLISADNSSPQKIWDDAVLTSSDDFNITYEPGTATLYNNVFTGGTTLADSIVTSAGAPIGYDKLDGKIPGCFQYSGDVTFKVKVHTIAPNFNVTKQVRLHGTTDWQKNITANPGQQVDYRIGYDNTGTAQQQNVVVKDKLPAGMSYAADSTAIKNASHADGDGMHVTGDEVVNGGGINIGDYNPDSNAFTSFTATLPSNDQLSACGMNSLVNTATVETNNGSKSDTATVNVMKICTTPSQALPTTGPAETTAVLIALFAITLGVVYWVRSRRDLRVALGDNAGASLVQRITRVFKK